MNGRKKPKQLGWKFLRIFQTLKNHISEKNHKSKIYTEETVENVN